MAVSKKKILVIDDDEIHLAMVEIVLKKEYEIATTKSGKEALEMFMHGTAPDLILLDIMMPSMDGWETFNRLKAISLLRSVPIIFLSSVTDENEMDRAYKMGAADFITKPYDRTDLKERIKKVLFKK